MNDYRDTHYYRYYTGESGGYEGALKYYFSPLSFARLDAAVSNPYTATDAQVEAYADIHLEYDDARQVTKSVVQAEGCSSCGNGQGEFTYSYQTSSFADGYNNWRRKTVESLPDGSERIVFSNFAGQVMLEVIHETVSGDEWLTWHKYDGDGRLVQTAHPSAVTGYDESKADLLNNQSGDYQYLDNSNGLIEARTYYTSTTATSTTAGGVNGYLHQAKIKRGENGTEVLQSTLDYFDRTAGGMTLYPEASHTVYGEANGTGAQKTSYDYTWHSGTVQAESVEVSLPVVGSTQNGPGTADESTTFYDDFGRPTWSRDADGYLTYTEYDEETSAVVKAIVDVDTTETSDFSDLPSGWSTPTGGGLHLITTMEVDPLGRTTKLTDANGNITYTVYDDDNYEVRTYAGWDSGSNAPTGPTVVQREDRGSSTSYFETLTMSATPSLTSGEPNGTEAIADIETLSRSYVNAGGQVIREDVYFDVGGLTYGTGLYIGTEGSHYYRTDYGYDDRGRRDRVENAEGTITRTVYDHLNRVSSVWIGTDDTPTTGEWSPTNNAGANMTKVSENEYDDDDVGDGNRTQVTQIPGGSEDDRVTESYYDWRNRLVATKQGVEATESTGLNRQIVYMEYDNLNQVTAQERYDGDGVTITDGNSDGVPDKPSSGKLRARATTKYDDQSRAYETSVFSVNQSTGAVSTDSLTTSTWRNHRGQVIKTEAPGGLVSKAEHDGAGRVTTTYTSDGGGDTGWSDAEDVTSDKVLEQVEYTYDDNGNVILTTHRQRFHDETGTGELGTPSTGTKARVSYVAQYYDKANRLTDTVNVGTNGGSSYTRPSTVPSRSDTVLVSSQSYNDAGWVDVTTDPRGIETRLYYDNMGRRTKAIEAYDDGAVSDTNDKTVEFTYDGNSNLLTVKAYLTSTAYEETEYVYGVTGSTSEVDSNDILAETRYPDASTGDSSSSEKETYTVNALGERLTLTDRNGNVHTYSRDVVGRLTADAVTTLGTGVDGAIRRIETAYDTAGRPYLFTSYDATTGGNVVNEVQRDFNGLSQLITEYQEHGGAVNTGTSAKVQYAYSEMASSANHSRLTSTTYPDGRVLNYDYDAGLDDDISRLSSLSETATTIEEYEYLGLGTVVLRAHPETDVDLTYIKQSGEGNGDAGDQYTGLDRFGRVVDQRWLDTGAGSHTDRFQYGHDRNSNRLYRDNIVKSDHSEVYQTTTSAYDDLNQLTDFARGTLNANKDGISGTASRTQSWDFDALGNWDSVTTDSSTETRSHNKQNEITSISGATTPTFDSNGNMTGDENGNDLKYDAWNRLVEVKSGMTTLTSYEHDGLNRRIEEDPGTARALFYSAQWQVIEEREGGLAVVQHVWSPVYVDAIILRDRDADSNSGNGLEERLYAQHDANFNITALIDTTGSVVERFIYDPYGAASVLTPAWASRTSSNYDWQYLHQGGRHDSNSGLYHFRNRDYSAILGRWIQNDPIGFEGGDLNLYRYVGNNSINAIDPSGLIVITGTGLFVGGVIVTGVGAATAGILSQPSNMEVEGRPNAHIDLIVLRGPLAMTASFRTGGNVQRWVQQTFTNCLKRFARPGIQARIDIRFQEVSKKQFDKWVPHFGLRPGRIRAFVFGMDGTYTGPGHGQSGETRFGINHEDVFEGFVKRTKPFNRGDYPLAYAITIAHELGWHILAKRSGHQTADKYLDSSPIRYDPRVTFSDTACKAILKRLKIPMS